MSTSVNTYVILGVKLGYNNDDYTYARYCPYFDNPYKAGIRHHNDVCVVLDGMNGEYVLAGTVLAKSGPDEPLEGTPLELVASEQLKYQTAKALEKELGIKDREIGLWIVEHYH